MYAPSSDFKSVSQVLKELPQEKKDCLLEKFSEIIRHLKATDASMHLSLIKRDKTVYQNTINIIKDFVTSDLNMDNKS